MSRGKPFAWSWTCQGPPAVNLPRSRFTTESNPKGGQGKAAAPAQRRAETTRPSIRARREALPVAARTRCCLDFNTCCLTDPAGSYGSGQVRGRSSVCERCRARLKPWPAGAVAFLLRGPGSPSMILFYVTRAQAAVAHHGPTTRAATQNCLELGRSSNRVCGGPHATRRARHSGSTGFCKGAARPWPTRSTVAR